MIHKLAPFSFLLFDDFTTIHNGILIVQYIARGFRGEWQD